MKRINVILSETLARRVESLAERKETTVSELARRSLEAYLERFPERPMAAARIPTVNLGKEKTKDLKKEVYEQEWKKIGRQHG